MTVYRAVADSEAHVRFFPIIADTLAELLAVTPLPTDVLMGAAFDLGVLRFDPTDMTTPAGGVYLPSSITVASPGRWKLITPNPDDAFVMALIGW